MKNLNGFTVEAKCNEGFYKRVKGVVTGCRNGFYQIEATEVISNWSDKWKDHPTSCAMGVKPENIINVTFIQDNIIAFCRTRKIAENRINHPHEKRLTKGTVSKKFRIEEINGNFIVKCKTEMTEENKRMLDAMFA